MPLTKTRIDELARQVWDYHHVNHELVKSDCILAQGSHDLRVAERAAQLYLDGWAPLLIVSGGYGNLTEGVFDEPEADKFARIALDMGVPDAALLIENRSTNTGENVTFTQQLLAKRSIDPQSFILVQKPYMERRTLATFAKRWPDKGFVVTSPQISFDNYPNEQITREQVIHIMVGDLQRIRDYPARGFQIEQPISELIHEAFEQLVAAGYTNHLIK